MLGKNTFVLAFIFLLKLAWVPFNCNLFIKYSTFEEDQQNQELSVFFSILKFQPRLYVMGWFMLIKVYFTEREESVTEKRRKKKAHLILLIST